MRRVGALLAVVVCAGCGGHSAERVPPSAIAVVGDRAISHRALDAELARARRAYSARGQDFPATGTPAYERVEQAAVSLLVDRARLELEAQRAGVAVSKQQVDLGLRRVKRHTFGGDESRFREQLRRTGMTEVDVRAAIRTQLLASALRGREIEAPPVAYAPGFEPGSGR